MKGVLARLAADAAAVPDSEEAFPYLVNNIARAGSVGPENPTAAAALAAVLDGAVGVTSPLDGSSLTVRAPSCIQDELAACLEAWEQSGLGQICVKWRFITADHDIAEGLGVSWQFQESRSPPAAASLSASGLRAAGFALGAEHCRAGRAGRSQCG